MGIVSEKKNVQWHISIFFSVKTMQFRGSTKKKHFFVFIEIDTQICTLPSFADGSVCVCVGMLKSFRHKTHIPTHRRGTRIILYFIFHTLDSIWILGHLAAKTPKYN